MNEIKHKRKTWLVRGRVNVLRAILGGWYWRVYNYICGEGDYKEGGVWRVIMGQGACGWGYMLIVVVGVVVC